MPDCILAMDAGGTGLKYGLMGMDCAPLPGATLAQRPMTGVLAAFAGAAGDAADQAARLGCAIRMVGVCCPGPFDFARGMSRMTHKWQDAFERPIAPVLRGRLGGVPVRFLHDSSAYVLGEALLGAGRGHGNVAGVMLGTGFGFGFTRGGRVQVLPDQSPRVKLWNSPFGDGIVEDAVSRRAIRARYAALGGDAGLDVRDIAQAARDGDARAQETFARTGALLGDILAPVLSAIGCDRLVLGGQIARSADLLLPGIRLDAAVAVAAHLEDAALRGIALYCARGHAATMEEGRTEEG